MKAIKLLMLIVGSVAFTVVLALILGALSVSGVINMEAVRVLLFIAWLVGIAGVVGSEIVCSRPWKHYVSIGLIFAVVFGGGLILLDQWIVRTKAEQDARATPPPLPKKITNPPIPPAIAFVRTPKNPPRALVQKNTVSGNQNVVGNTVTQGSGGISQIGNGNTVVVPQPKIAEDTPRGPIGVLNHEGAIADFTCSNINVPNGTAVDNHGQFEAHNSTINGTSQPCTPEEEKYQGLESLLRDTRYPHFEDVQVQRVWARTSLNFISTEFGEKKAEEFKSQPGTKERIEFIRKLRDSLRP
jgi:hypothetical protein